MRVPALGSAAATLAVSLLYMVSAPTPDARIRAARADSEAPRARTVPLRSESSAAPNQMRDCTGLCDGASGRANQHWMEYLEFRRVAGPATGGDNRRKAKLPSS